MVNYRSFKHTVKRYYLQQLQLFKPTRTTSVYNLAFIMSEPLKLSPKQHRAIKLSQDYCPSKYNAHERKIVLQHIWATLKNARKSESHYSKSPTARYKRRYRKDIIRRLSTTLRALNFFSFSVKRFGTATHKSINKFESLEKASE